MEHQEIPTLEDHISSEEYTVPTSDTLPRTLDFLQDVYNLIDQDELNEHDPEYEYYLANFSNTVNTEDTKQIIDRIDEHRIEVRFGAFFLLVKAYLDNFVDYARLTDIDERWGMNFRIGRCIVIFVHKFISEGSA